MKKHLTLLCLLFACPFAAFQTVAAGSGSSWVHDQKTIDFAADKINWNVRRWTYELTKSGKKLSVAEATSFFKGDVVGKVETQSYYVPGEMWPAIFTFYGDGKITHDFHKNNRTDTGTWWIEDEGGKAVLCLKFSDWPGIENKTFCRDVYVGSLDMSGKMVKYIVYTTKQGDDKPRNIYFRAQ